MASGLRPVNPALAGPIRVSADGRHFVDATGAPFFWLGDTAWPLFTHYPRQVAEAYLEDRGRRGFTVVQAIVGWGGGTGGAQPVPGPNGEGEMLWLEGPARPNERFFGPVDHLLEVAGRNGLVVAVFPIHGHYVNEARRFDPDSARAYGRWLGERYRRVPNLVWVNGGDRIPTGFEEVYRALARGLREGDGGSHLITYHPCGWRSSAQFFHREDWLDFNMIETWTEWSKVYPAVLADLLLTPPKPVVLGEGAYEDGPEYPQGPITPLVVRRQAWWTFMAGGFHTYGQNQLWRMEPGWTATFGSPGAQQMGILGQIVKSRPWWNTYPDQTLFASGVGCERTLNAARRALDGTCALVYLSSQCHVLLYLDRIATRSVKVTWVNPADGQEQDGGTWATGNLTGSPFPQAGRQWFAVPGHWEDAVLILEGVD